MALATRSGLPVMVVLLVVLVTAEHAVAIKIDASAAFGHFPALLDCAPKPPPSNNDGAFRANVLSALAELPSAAAAAPTGFAATRSSGGAGDRAFARGLCFGVGKRRGSSRGDCLACLSAAARDVVVAGAGSGCGSSRRGAVWRAGCFLAYADTNASSAHEDAFRGWFYADGSGPAAALGSQCAGDRAAAECSRCANESARVVPAMKRRGHHLARVHGDAVVVVGYDCYLRVPIDDALPPWQLSAGDGLDFFLKM
ncbi:unnamed protein product [Urochloa decumbens]|uniref:Gnk2-homologous domain-containing protein n=1 Tax=Urochloa decumbens TaxID=240449 RepID=A0ABC8YEB1_9POAL